MSSITLPLSALLYGVMLPGTMASANDVSGKRRAALVGAMLERGADRVGVTITDLATATGWKPLLVAALLAGASADGEVDRMGQTPTGATLYTVHTGPPHPDANPGHDLHAVTAALLAARNTDRPFLS